MQPNGGSPPMFALVIAGRPLDTNFQPVDAKKMMAAIPQPAAVHEFTIALLQPALPPVTTNNNTQHTQQMERWRRLRLQSGGMECGLSENGATE